MGRPFLVAAALLVAGCRVGKVDLRAGLQLDDGACSVSPGNFAAAAPADVVAAATDGTRIFTVDGGPSGDLRSQPVGGGTAVVLARGGHADNTRWERGGGWLAADDRFVYWLAKPSPSSGSVPPRLMRFLKSSGVAEVGFAPPPTRELIATAGDLLLLGDDGLWQIDRKRWGKARLIAPGAFAHVAADQGRAFLLAARDPPPQPDVGPSLRIVVVDRATGTVGPFFESSDVVAAGPLRADETHLYLEVRDGRSAVEPRGSLCKRPTLLRLAKKDGAVERIPLPCPAGEDLAVSGDDIYWIDRTAKRVMHAPKTGGRVAISGKLACAGVDNRLLAVGARLYAWNADGSCPLQTGTPNGTAAKVVALVEGIWDLLAATDTAAFATADGRVRRIALTDGAIEDLKYPDGEPVAASEGVASGDGDLSFIHHDAAIEPPYVPHPVGHFVGRWSARSARVSRVFEGLARLLVASGPDVYFVSGRSIVKLAGAAGAETRAITLVKDAGDVQSLAVSRRKLFWSVVRNTDDKAGRSLWTAGLDGSGPAQLAEIDWLDLVAADPGGDAEAPLYSTFGQSTSLLSTRDKIPGRVFRYGRWGSGRLADDQDDVRSLVVTPLGVAWWQQRGMRWQSGDGPPRAVDACAGMGRGLAVVGRRIIWADAYAGALMETSPPP
jgi:hypothetical protein